LGFASGEPLVAKTWTENIRSLTPFARGEPRSHSFARTLTATTAQHHNSPHSSPTDSLVRFTHSLIHRQNGVLTSLHSPRSCKPRTPIRARCSRCLLTGHRPVRTASGTFGPARLAHERERAPTAAFSGISGGRRAIARRISRSH